MWSLVTTRGTSFMRAGSVTAAVAMSVSLLPSPTGQQAETMTRNKPWQRKIASRRSKERMGRYSRLIG